MWGEQSRSPPPTDKTTRHSGSTVGKVEGVRRSQPGAVAQGPAQSMCGGVISWALSRHWLNDLRNLQLFSFFFPPDQRHSRKMAFPRFYKSVQQLFLFPFSVFLALCMWWRRLGCMSDNVDVLQWACEWMCVFKGLWELVRFRSGWGAVQKNGWQCVSLYWQTRESCLPPVSLGQISPIYFKYI